LYQLESYFGDEYDKNPDFRAFIQEQEPDVKAFKERCFESSRRALNLIRRMESHCPEEKDRTENLEGTTLTALPNTFMKLGKELGYFDEEGNLLKPFTQPAAEPDPQEGVKQQSKRKQIQYLEEQVAQLPVGPETQNKIAEAKTGLGKARPKLGLLKGALALMGSRLGTFLPGPIGLVGKAKTLNDILGVLSNFKPKLPFPGLLSKIGDLFQRGKKLGEKARALADRSKKLKDRFDQVQDKAAKAQQKLQRQEDEAETLENQLADLKQKKEELTRKLEDKPRSILEELHDQVAKAKDEAGKLVEEAKKVNQKKDELLDEIAELEQQKKEIEDQLDALEQETEQVKQETEQLEEEVQAAQQEVEQAKAKEAKLENLQEQMEDLKPEDVLAQELKLCRSDFEQMLADLTGVEQTQGKLRTKLGKLLSKPGRLLDKAKDLKLFQNRLKLGKEGIPVAEKTLSKLEDLSQKATLIGDIAQILTGKETRLQQRVNDIDGKISNARTFYDTRIKDLDQLQNDLLQLVAEKTGLNDKLDQAGSDIAGLENQVNDFLNRYRLFDEETDCLSLEELREKLRDIEQEQQTTEPEIDEALEDLEAAEEEAEQVEEATEALEQEIEEEAEVKEEEKTLQEEYDTDTQLEPVTKEEWSESFQVERPYWDAVFHPDDEVVEGYKGRYFEVRLKDADQAVKLLFGAGEYFLSRNDFRKRYGLTIGTFVSEALLALKKTDREKIKVFIQGSADIVGQATFSGNLDEGYFYDAINVLPQQPGGERFLGSPETRDIPTRNFRNEHLPNLRGRFLKEMITVYSKKLEPVLLEGSVKAVKDEADRNAVIYLFLPEEMLD
jgi:predicted  nucleic acid-binding Zn-ribbon protein